MKNTLFFILAIGTLLLLSCYKKTPNNYSQGFDKRLISNTYKEPRFVKDQRLKSLTTIVTELRQIFDEHATNNKIPGIAYGIVVDDSLVIASATGVSQIESKTPASINTSFRIASMTKSFTAMAIVKLRDEGKLSLNDPVVNYIPEIENLEYLTEDSPIIEIENLLTMTGGFPEDNPWADRQLAISDKEFLEIVSEGLSLSNVSSYRYEYSNTGYALLGQIISKVSGKPYQEYIKENILYPLRMNKTYWEYGSVPKDQLASGYSWEDDEWKKKPLLHDGSFGAIGGLITSIEDFSKYVSFHLSAWPARSDEDNGPVKRSSIREMHTAQYNFLNSRSRDWNNEPCASMSGYGYGFRISLDCRQILRVSHGGGLPGFASNFAFFPEYGIGVMAFGNLTGKTPIPYRKIEKLLFEQLDLPARKLPASDILEQKRGEIVDLFTSGKISFDKEIFAENFFQDKSRERRIIELQRMFNKVGAIKEIQEIDPRNQLRGDFTIQCENGTVKVFFSLTPEKIPMIQKLDISFTLNEN